MQSLKNLWWMIRWSSRATAWMHVLAMWLPFNSWRLFFYRLRGIRIGKGVWIAQGSFLEESRPWLITIEDNVKISAGATIVTHDEVYHALDNSIPYRFGPVVLERGAIVGPRAVVLPWVTVGERAFVAAGAVVSKDVPADTMVAGVPARHLMTNAEGLDRARTKVSEYAKIADHTKYPWVYRRMAHWQLRV